MEFPSEQVLLQCQVKPVEQSANSDQEFNGHCKIRHFLCNLNRPRQRTDIKDKQLRHFTWGYENIGARSCGLLNKKLKNSYAEMFVEEIPKMMSEISCKFVLHLICWEGICLMGYQVFIAFCTLVRQSLMGNTCASTLLDRIRMSIQVPNSRKLF